MPWQPKGKKNKKPTTSQELTFDETSLTRSLG